MLYTVWMGPVPHLFASVSNHFHENNDGDFVSHLPRIPRRHDVLKELYTEIDENYLTHEHACSDIFFSVAFLNYRPTFTNAHVVQEKLCQVPGSVLRRHIHFAFPRPAVDVVFVYDGGRKKRSGSYAVCLIRPFCFLHANDFLSACLQ